MTLLDTTPTTPATAAPAAPEARRSPLAGRWPLAAFVAAVSIGAYPMVGAVYLEDDTTGGGLSAVYDAVSDQGVGQHVSMDLAFVGALAMAVFGAGFVRFLAARTPVGSLAATVGRLGVGAAVGLLVAVASLKAVYRGGLPDHGDHTMYTPDSVAALNPFIDQFQYTGLWPMTLTMGAVAVLALQHRTLPRWYGVLSAVLLVATLLMALVLGLPYFAGIVGPLWLVASGVVVLRHRDA